MNDPDLREHFEQWAAPLRTTPVPGVAGLRRRARRRSARRYAAAASVAAMAAIAAVIIGAVQPPDRISSATQTRPVLAPFVRQRYTAPRAAPFVVVYGRGGQLVRVIDAASGATWFSGRPGPEAAMFTAIAAAASDRLFVLAQQSEQNRTSFDVMHIYGDGAEMTPVMSGVSLPLGYQIYGMTVNPQGTRLALNTMDGNGVGPLHLRVYNLTTGALLANFAEGGFVQLQNWQSEYRLAFTWSHDRNVNPDDFRVLDTQSALTGQSPTALQADSVADAAVQGYDRGAFTADGLVAIDVQQSASEMVVTEYSAATGAQLREFWIGTLKDSEQAPTLCGVLWASANGADLLTQCGNVQQAVVNGKASRVRLAITIPSSQVGWADTFAW